MNAIEKLRLLAWRYYYFRRYHFFMNIVEIMLPISLVYIVITISESLVHSIPSLHNETIEARVTFENMEYCNYSKIYYAPDNKMTNLFVFGEKQEYATSIHGLHYYTRHLVSEIKSYHTEKEMVFEMLKTKQNVIGVVFETIYPVLKYKLRDNNIWNTSELFVDAEKEQSGPYFKDPYLDSGFACIQHTINTVFIKDMLDVYNQTIGNAVLYTEGQKSFFQPFPYPEYIESSSVHAMIPLFIGFVIIISSFVLTSPLIVAIITEKESGMKEWMRIAGLESRYLWISWFLNSLLVSVIVYTVVTFIMFPIFGVPVFRVTQPWLIWACIILYYMAQISFCFVFCAIFNSTAIASASFALITLIMAFISVKIHDWQNIILVYITCIFPSGAFIQAFVRISYHELLGIRSTWSNIFAKENNSTDASLGHIMWIFLGDLLLYFFLTYYISAVKPGKYGSRRPWYFLFREERVKKKRKSKRSLASEDAVKKQEESDKFTEEPSPDMELSLEIKGLKKKFKSVQALRRVNLSMYKNQILVLLGHNGAGKTTTMSVLTGLTKPTDGTIFYKGSINILKNMKKFRKMLGTCPQENRLFPYLSVLNHLIFFGRLKGDGMKQAQAEAHVYLRLMDMIKKSHELPSALSTAMKRKLCLAISLMGKAEVLILDEPTAGVDHTSRKRICNLLKELKIGRTIIMSTHIMQEAAEIGDRIAIMNHGVVACSGSVNFLKKTFEAGYQLKIHKKRDPLMFAKTLKDTTQELTDLIIKSVPGSKLERRSTTELLFYLPTEDKSKLPAFFKGLENKKAAFNIQNMSLSYTTLDQIFSKVGAESFYDAEGKLVKQVSIFDDPVEIKPVTEKAMGLNLQLLQHEALTHKKSLFLLRNSVTFFFRVVFPTILMLFLIRGTVIYHKVEPELLLNLDSYPNADVALVENDFSNEHYSTYLDNLNIPSSRVRRIRQAALIPALLEYARSNINSYRRDIIIANDLHLNSTSHFLEDRPFVTMYNKWLRHSLPIAVNTAHNAILQIIVQNKSFAIIASNHPIRTVNVTRFEGGFDPNVNENSPLLIVWFVLIAFFTVDLLDYFTIPIKVERIDGFKHIQYLSSVSPFTYWTNTFVFDFFLFFAIVIIRILTFAPFDDFGFFSFQSHMGLIFLLLVLFAVSGLLFMYSLSFTQTSKNESYMFFFIFNLACVFVVFTYHKIEPRYFNGGSLTDLRYIIFRIFRYIILLVPPLNFSLAIKKLIMAWRMIHVQNRDHDYPMLPNATASPTMLKARQSPYLSYLVIADEHNPNGILTEVIFLFFDIFLYAVILYISEKDSIGKIMNKYKKKDVTPPDPENPALQIPNDVLQERNKVDMITKSSDPHPSNVVLVAKDLRKIFTRFWQPPLVALSNATFLVTSGERFALLGREGGGKTSTFRLLTGETLPTEGESWILNTKLSTQRNKYLSRIGYCAETNYFLEDLTGRELLEMIATLRGIDSESREFVIEKWLVTLDLVAVQNKKCKNYSGGSKRKLCAAMAFIGDPNVVLLDEVTTGVDPISRQKLFYVLTETKSVGQSILISDHSLADAQLICDRLSVMANGEMKFIGSINDLKKRYGVGFTLMVKMKEKLANETEQVRKLQVMVLKKAVSTKFKSVLKQEEQNSLYYHIKEPLPLSEAFLRTEELKKSQKIISDYLLTDTNLDEVFEEMIK